MSQLNNIVVVSIVSLFMISGVYSIAWSSINLNKPNKDQLFQGENVHFMWESTSMDSCIDVKITMFNSGYQHSFMAERQPGFIRKIMPCVSSGQYMFRIECGQNSATYNKTYTMLSVVDGFNFYQNPTSRNIITWHEKVSVLVQKNISIFSYPNMELLKTVIITRGDDNVQDINYIDFQMQVGQKYKIRTFDFCNNMIGENKPKFDGEIKEFFSTEFPLEPSTSNPTGPTTIPGPTPAPGPTTAPAPRPGPGDDNTGSAVKTTVSLGFLAFLAVL